MTLDSSCLRTLLYGSGTTKTTLTDRTARQLSSFPVDRNPSAADILKEIRDATFDSSDEKLAVALERSSGDITKWLNGEEKVDSDALIKARALAREPGVEHE